MEVFDMKRLRCKNVLSRCANFMWMLLMLNMTQSWLEIYMGVLYNCASKCSQDLKEGIITTIPIILKIFLIDHYELMRVAFILIFGYGVYRWLRLVKFAAFEIGWRQFELANRRVRIYEIVCILFVCVTHCILECAVLETRVEVGTLTGNIVVQFAIAIFVRLVVTCIIWCIERNVGMQSHCEHQGSW